MCQALTFTFMHLADAFIQSDLQCTQVIHVLSVCVFLGIKPAANAMLFHLATGTLLLFATEICAKIQHNQIEEMNDSSWPAAN